MSRLSGLPFRASLSRLGLVAPAVTHQSHPEAENLKEILTQPPEQFICISGPSGSGKGDLLNAATADIKAKLEIDFTALFKHHDTAGDTSVHLAKQVGYFPYFSGWRQLSSLADAASVGLTGVKAGKLLASLHRSVIENHRLVKFRGESSSAHSRVCDGKPTHTWKCIQLILTEQPDRSYETSFGSQPFSR